MRILIEAGLLEAKSERKGPTKGREREEYRVNPVVFRIEPDADPDAMPGVRRTNRAA